MHFLEAFLKEEAFPCGYCTPGMIMSAIIAAIQKAASGKKAEAHG